MDRPTLHMLCGKAASGKSTLAAGLGAKPGTVVLSEDVWLATLFGDQMHSLRDYARYSARLRNAVAPHVIDLLDAGLSVVLDFPANTRETRGWLRGIVEASDAEHVMHVLDVPDEVCKERLRRRNGAGEHPFSVTDEQFDLLATYFDPVGVDEGFTIRRHPSD
ncbi:ATP-binding protein [Maritimibacter sp. DP1N21-5]|uniref:AAA family ATPase n=1 Tax=Maritimibacter sp. DP1N21-5 TaxID=2836867 RepID=UPI001C46C9E8|nr:ATP-binding protein [Maritimibacter sp. DP1N21-5]MBV7410905.1 ATP-binding protein [Maritimibacter sp. DP1N21-5]